MKYLKYLAVFAMFFGLIALFSGCNSADMIKVEYLPGSEAQNWFADNPGEQPTIAVNPLSDEREDKAIIGETYGVFGGKPTSWVSEDKPTEIIEAALISQLEKAGFRVIKTSGWNLDAGAIPALDADFIMGGRLKAFWVESRAGAWNADISSKAEFDLIIADVKTKQIVWSGLISSANKNAAFSYWNTKTNVSNAINQTLTQAINKVFQEEQPKQAILTLWQVKF